MRTKRIVVRFQNLYSKVEFNLRAIRAIRAIRVLINIIMFLI